MLHWNIPKWHFVFINVDVIGVLPHYKLITRVEPTKVHLLSNICVIQGVASNGLYRMAKVFHFCKIHVVKPTACSHLYQIFIHIKRTLFSFLVIGNFIWIESLLSSTQRKQTILFIGVTHTVLFSASTRGEYVCRLDRMLSGYNAERLTVVSKV